MKKQWKGIFLAGAAVVLMSGCAKFPETEVDATKNAVENAGNAGASIYVPEQFNALQDSLNAVMVSLQEQKSRWFANYDPGKERLSTISKMADDLVLQTEARKTEIRAEIQGTLDQIRTLLNENSTLIAQAPRGKEGTAALTQIQDELLVVQAAVDEADALLKTDQLLATRDKANAAREKAVVINTELKDVIAKYSKRRS